MNPDAAPQPRLAALAALEQLRRSGRWRADPARFRYLEALARRIPGQAAPLRLLLQARLEAALALYPVPADTQPAPRVARTDARSGPASPLAQLLQQLQAARPQAETGAGEELASARRFRAAWDAQRALEKLERALAQRPAQAGPLNSHALVLQSLELMRGLSPAYLRQFMLQVESLQWLADMDEQAGGTRRQDRKAPSRRARAARNTQRRQDK